MNYIGSKKKLSPFLQSSIQNTVGDLSDKVFCDIFAGSGIVGRIFKTKVKKVISNDFEYYSYVVNRNYIGNIKPIKNYCCYIDELNTLKLSDDGFIYNNYCLGSGCERMYFSDYNGKKIDTIRKQIEIWKNKKFIDQDTYYFLLCSLLESADKVANTASVYGAYLKKIKKSAQMNMVLQPAFFDETNTENDVYNCDANYLIKNISGDILYLDPPYNSRQYGANYHMLNTIAEYIPFVPKGKTGLRRYLKSNYCIKSKALLSLEDLIKNADFKYIFLSYNNEGIISGSDIRYVMEKYGEYDLLKTNHTRFKADSSDNRIYKAQSTVEYLHVLKKQY